MTDPAAAAPATRDRLRVVIATDLSEALCDYLQASEPRVEVVRNHELYRPMRWPADWPGDPAHRRNEEQQALFAEMLDSADILFSIPDAAPQELARTVRANPNLTWVQVMAAGGGAQVKAAGLDAAELERVTFTTSAGVHGSTLAEFALFGLLAGAKDLPRLQRDQHERVWEGRRLMRHLDEMTVLVVGMGGIGSAVIERLAPFGTTIWGTSRSGRSVAGVDRVIAADDIAAVAGEVDAIVVTLPGTASTEHLIGAEVLGAIKPGAIVVNVGRGSVIDEAALLPALDEGRVAFAALDVFETEPLPRDSRLWSHPNVLVSPHTAALSAQEDRRIVDLFLDNLRRYLDGDELRNVVDTVDFY